MPRFKLTLEYHGGPFVGWQRQENGPSLQGAVEDAAAALAGAPCAVYGAGRTDAGVHALGQVAHVDFAQDWPPDTVRDALNHHLRPAPIAVTAVERVGAEFHARFDAVERRYLYRLVDRRAPLTLAAGTVWRAPTVLDAEAMHRAAQALVGRHDFTTFRDSQCQAESPVKTLDQIGVVRRAGPWAESGALNPQSEVWVTCAARSFLHRQVRSIVGALVEVGRGKWPEARVGDSLAARDRAACGPVAPPDGLYLAAVIYPEGASSGSAK